MYFEYPFIYIAELINKNNNTKIMITHSDYLIFFHIKTMMFIELIFKN